MTGCGPVVPAADLEAVCGEDSPHRLLALDADERVAAVSAVGERRYFILTPEFDPADLQPGVYFPTADASRVVSTGACGEDPREVGRDVFRVFENERFPGVVFGCDRSIDGGVVVIDPSGAEPPRAWMAAPACDGVWTDHGVVAAKLVSDGTSEVTPLLRFPYPASVDAEPVAPVVLVEAAPIGLPRFGVVGDDAFVTEGDDLLRVSLPSGEVTVEQAGVAQWRITSDGRVLAWIDLATYEGNGIDGKGTIVVRDRTTGESIQVEASAFSQFAFGVVSPDVLMLDIGPGVGTGVATATRLVFLPELSSIDLPVDRKPFHPLDGGRWLTGLDWNGPYVTRDLESGAETILADVAGSASPFDEKHLVVYEGALFDDSEAPASAVWKVPLDGSAAQKMADRSGSVRRLLDAGLVTLVDVDEQWIGDLVLVDPESREERRIDDHVFRTGVLVGAPWAEENEILYAVVDGARSGAWLARLAP